jgi:ACS family sodium-dependent inorganic phosphate cotransporter
MHGGAARRGARRRGARHCRCARGAGCDGAAAAADDVVIMVSATTAAVARPTRARLLMYALTSGVTAFNFLLRQGIPTLIPFITAEYGWSSTEAALLLSGFFPGYMLTQIPGGWAAQVCGGKAINALNLGGQTLFLLALPVAARAGAMPLAGVLTCLGLCQGPLVPAQAVVQRHWMPAGPERAWASRVTQIGQRIGKIATTGLTPWLAATRGWRSVPYIYGYSTGLFTAIWCLLAANTPREWVGPWRPRMGELEVQLLEAGTNSGGRTKQRGQTPTTRAFPWHIFRVKAAVVIILMHTAANATEYTLTQWAPTFFIEMHGVDPAQLGRFLALPQSVAFAFTFVSAALENIALRAGVPLLRVRKVVSAIVTTPHRPTPPCLAHPNQPPLTIEGVL